MFEVFFNKGLDYGSGSAYQRKSSGQFINGDWGDIIKGNYRFGIITWQDWQGILGQYDIRSLLEQYQVKKDLSTDLLLLERR